jgi:hypothetical protein
VIKVVANAVTAGWTAVAGQDKFGETNVKDEAMTADKTCVKGRKLRTKL